MFARDARSTDSADFEGIEVALPSEIARPGATVTAVVVPRAPWCGACMRRPRTLEEMTRRVVLTAGEIETKGD